MASWSDPLSTITGDICDEIDAIMKHEHEDVILLDHSLPVTPLNFDFDSLSDLLENPSSSNTSYTQPWTINEHLSSSDNLLTTTNNSQSNTTTSAYSSLGISPKFTTLSIHPASSLSLSYVPTKTIQLAKCPAEQEASVLATSYPFPLVMKTMSSASLSSDVKRFRSASMNESSTICQQTSANCRKLYDRLLSHVDHWTCAVVQIRI
jgi:hypothetical protein